MKKLNAGTSPPPTPSCNNRYSLSVFANRKAKWTRDRTGNQAADDR